MIVGSKQSKKEIQKGMNETRMRQQFRARLGHKVIFSRIETGWVTPGMPDDHARTNLYDIFLEYKVVNELHNSRIKIRYQENQQRWAREHQHRNGIVFLVVADKLGSVAFFKLFENYIVWKDCILLPRRRHHVSKGGHTRLFSRAMSYREFEIRKYTERGEYLGQAYMGMMNENKIISTYNLVKTLSQINWEDAKQQWLVGTN